MCSNLIGSSKEGTNGFRNISKVPETIGHELKVWKINVYKA